MANSRHSVSKAGEIYGGDVVLPGLQGGRIGAPLGNAVVRFKYEGLTPGAVVATLNASTPINTRIPVNQLLAYMDSDYPDTAMGVVITATSVGNESGKNLIVRGQDGAGQEATKQIALANVGAAESPIGWGKIDHIEIDSTLVNTVTITTIAKYSFPFAVWGDGDELSQVYLDGTLIASPSKTNARTSEDTITGADARGLLNLTGETVSDAKLTYHLYVNRTSQQNAVGLKVYSDIPVANFVSA